MVVFQWFHIVLTCFDSLFLLACLISVCFLFVAGGLGFWWLGFSLFLVWNSRVRSTAFLGREGMHPHRDMEILTFIIDGRLTHKELSGSCSCRVTLLGFVDVRCLFSQYGLLMCWGLS